MAWIATDCGVSGSTPAVLSLDTELSPPLGTAHRTSKERGGQARFVERDNDWRPMASLVGDG